MNELEGTARTDRSLKLQIAFEFLVVYSFVLIVFLVLFVAIAGQRAAVLNQQEYTTLQLVAQNVASYINQAAAAGSGYNVSVPMAGSIGAVPFNLTISTTGIVIASERVGSQVISAYAYSGARSLVINGAETQTSTNAIQLYVIPEAGGLLRLTNSRGTVYVDMTPPSIANQTNYINVAQVASVKAARLFEGGTVNSFVYLPSARVDLEPAVTMSMWIDPLGINQGTSQALYEEGLASGCSTFGLGTSGTGDVEVNVWNVNTGGFWMFWTSPTQLASGSWQFLTFTLANGGTGTGTGSIYLNGVLSSSNTVQEEVYTASKAVAAIGGGVPCPGAWDGTYNGFISDVQIYNATLSAANVMQLYSEGIGGAPLSAYSANVAGWWPLDGNTNDYSGNGDSGAGYNVIYNGVTQFSVTPFNTSGGIPRNAIIGDIVPQGNVIAGPNENSYMNVTASSRPADLFVTSNGISGSANVVITGFNGNFTATKILASPKELVGWWPLDEGSGIVAHDLSGSYNDVPFVSTAGGYPMWMPVNENVSNFQAANFPGNDGEAGTPATEGYIEIPESGTFNQLVTNGSVTAVVWVDISPSIPNPVTQGAGQQGVFGDGGEDNSGFQLEATTGDAGALLPALCPFYVNSIAVGCGKYKYRQGGGYAPYHEWTMMVGEYNNRTGVARVYINSTLLGSSNIGTGQSLAQNAPLFIGDDYYGGTFGDTLKGNVSNVQLYSNFLNYSQINYLYKQGPTGIPITSGAGLVGWWPLTSNSPGGTYRDYSIYGNNGTAYNTVMEVNAQLNPYNSVAASYYSPFATSPTHYALAFNPSANDIYTPGSVNLLPTGTNAVTVTTWIKPGQLQVDPTYDGVFVYGPRTCTPGGNTIQVGIKANGIPEIATWCNDFTPSLGTHVNFNAWNFVGYEVNGRNAYIFVNGKWINGTLSNPLYLQPGQIIIGGTDASGRVFNGSIADVQVYNAILTPQQLYQMYQAGLPPEIVENVTVG